MNKALIAIDRSKSFRVYLTISTDLVQEAAKIHDTTPLASAGLGRVLTAAGCPSRPRGSASDTGKENRPLGSTTDSRSWCSGAFPAQKRSSTESSSAVS